MYSVTANGDHTQPSVVEITADLLSDINNLPTTYGAGSTCIVIEDSSVWMLGHDQVWHEL